MGILLKLDDDYGIIISFLLLSKIIPGSCWGRKWATKGSQKHLHNNQSSKGTYVYRNFVIPVKILIILIISLQSSWDLLQQPTSPEEATRNKGSHRHRMDMFPAPNLKVGDCSQTLRTHFLAHRGGFQHAGTYRWITPMT